LLLPADYITFSLPEVNADIESKGDFFPVDAEACPPLSEKVTKLKVTSVDRG
jgi:hypothetical protein